MTTTKEINVLLLGETGAGKSTTMNSIVNYMRFSSCDEALESLENLPEIISTEFALRDRDDKSKQQLFFSGTPGPADQSKHEFGKSNTKAPMGYGNTRLRIIDTPGIGDTSGYEVDQNNFDKIFCFLRHHTQLNAIIFVVNGAITRSTGFFIYCISEILRNLHKSVVKNIIFCFTNSASSDFGPGNGYLTLKKLLEDELKWSNINLVAQVNSFFIDNDSFRYLVALKQKYSLRPIQSALCKDGWERSSQQVTEMFKVIIAMKPHQLNETISLHLIRKIVSKFEQPIVQVFQMIYDNIHEYEEKEKSLEACKSTREKLESLRNDVIWIVEPKTIPNASTVCTNRKCIEVDPRDGTISYNTVCHKKCSCLFVSDSIPGQAFLTLCEVMRIGYGKIYCAKCGCNWRYHMHHSLQYNKVKRIVINKDVCREIEKEEDLIKQVQKSLGKLKLLKGEFNAEKKIIMEVSAKFALVLKECSCMPLGDYFAGYVDFLMKNEEKKPIPNMAPLTNMKIEHERVLKMINLSSDCKVKIEDVPILRDILFQLKHTGPTFKDIINSVEEIQSKQHAYFEQFVLDLSKSKTPFCAIFDNLSS